MLIVHLKVKIMCLALNNKSYVRQYALQTCVQKSFTNLIGHGILKRSRILKIIVIVIKVRRVVNHPYTPLPTVAWTSSLHRTFKVKLKIYI